LNNIKLHVIITDLTRCAQFRLHSSAIRLRMCHSPY